VGANSAPRKLRLCDEPAVINNNESEAHHMAKTSTADAVLHQLQPTLTGLSRRLAGPRYQERSDYYQEGALGVCIAVSRLNRDRGSIVAYAGRWARGRMLNRMRAMKFRSREVNVGTFSETETELDQFYDSTAKDARKKLVDDSSPVRLLEQIDAKLVWRFAPRILTPKELRAIQLIYFEGITVRDAAFQMGVSSPRITQLISAALAKLRTWLTRPTFYSKPVFSIRGLRHADDGSQKSVRQTVAQKWVQKAK